MAFSSNNSVPGALLLPEEQTLTLHGPTGQDNITVALSEVDMVWSIGASGAISYGTQIGACFIMLVVLLLMTPKHRFKRAPTIIHTLALAFNMIRMLLLALYFPSTWFDLYTQMTADVRWVAQVDYNISVAATIFSIPVTILVEFALFLQAWSMVQLWPRPYKIPTTLLSVSLVITTIAFNVTVAVIQTRFILLGISPVGLLWVRRTYLGLTCASITWFCFLFNSRLVTHMWKNRTILPSLKGLHAMDVLVITNGFLMIVPGMLTPSRIHTREADTDTNLRLVIFAFLEFGEFARFESASLTQTSVIVVLPLGTLVAQRLANPTWFNSTAMNTNTSGGESSRRGLLAGSHGAHDRSFQTQSTGIVKSHISSEGRFHHADNIDAELAIIDGADLEHGVRVDHSIERCVEKARQGSGSGSKNS